MTRSERFPALWVGTPDVYEWIVWAALLQILKEQNCRILENELFSLDATKCVDTYWSNATDDLTNLSTTGCNQWLKYKMSVFWLTRNINLQISENTNKESIVKWLKVSSVRLKYWKFFWYTAEQIWSFSEDDDKRTWHQFVLRQHEDKREGWYWPIILLLLLYELHHLKDTTQRDSLQLLFCSLTPPRTSLPPVVNFLILNCHHNKVVLCLKFSCRGRRKNKTKQGNLVKLQ